MQRGTLTRSGRGQVLSRKGARGEWGCEQRGKSRWLPTAVEEAGLQTPKAAPVRLTHSMRSRQFAMRKNGKKPQGDDGRGWEKHSPDSRDAHKPEWETEQETADGHVGSTGPSSPCPIDNVTQVRCVSSNCQVSLQPVAVGLVDLPCLCGEPTTAHL